MVRREHSGVRYSLEVGQGRVLSGRCVEANRQRDVTTACDREVRCKLPEVELGSDAVEQHRRDPTIQR